MIEWLELKETQQPCTPPPTKKTQQSSGSLTKLVADALVVQQRRVVEGVPAVQDAGVGAHCGDAA